METEWVRRGFSNLAARGSETIINSLACSAFRYSQGCFYVQSSFASHTLPNAFPTKTSRSCPRHTISEAKTFEKQHLIVERSTDVTERVVVRVDGRINSDMPRIKDRGRVREPTILNLETVLYAAERRAEHVAAEDFARWPAAKQRKKVHE